MSVLFDLVAQTVSSAFGTGATIPLGGAANINGVTYLTYALAGANGGDSVIYSILDSSNSEVGTATYTSSNVTLTSRSPTKSTNGNATINGSSAAVITATVRAEDLPQLSAANTFTNTMTATKFLPSAASTTAWGLDFRNVTVTVSTGGFVDLADGSGGIILTDQTRLGATGMYLTGGSAAVLVAQTTVAAPYVASSSSPGSSHYSVAISCNSHYAIYNGSSVAITFAVATLGSRGNI